MCFMGLFQLLSQSIMILFRKGHYLCNVFQLWKILNQSMQLLRLHSLSAQKCSCHSCIPLLFPLCFWSSLSFQVPDCYKSQRGAICPGVWGQYFHCLSTSDSAHFDCRGCQWAWLGHLHPGMIDALTFVDGRQGREEDKPSCKTSQLPVSGSRI